MKVVAISASAALGGSEWSLLDFARRAQSLDIELGVLLPKSGPLEEELKKAAVPVEIARAPDDLLEMTRSAGAGKMLAATRGLATWSIAIARTAPKLFPRPADASKRQSTDVVWYSNGFKAHLAAALLKGKHVWHLREFPPARTGLGWKTLASAVPSSTIANSNAVAEAWALMGWKRPAVVYNGVDLERFRPAGRSGWIHDSLGIDRSARLIGMPAVLAKWKGQLQVVSAFEKASAELPGVHLVFVGGAIYDTKSERGFAEELVRRVRGASSNGTSLTDRIHFFRHQTEPWRLFPEFDVTVHFSTRPEPFGRVVAESLASGVPCIAARAGGPMEIIEHGVTGWLVPPGDIGALAGAMQHAIAAGSGAMSAACRASAERRFSADRYAAEVAAVLRRAAGA